MNGFESVILKHPEHQTVGWTQVGSTYPFCCFFWKITVNVLKIKHLTQYQRKQWQPTPVHLSGKSRGRRSLVGCSPWGRTRLSDFTFTFMPWRRKWQPTPVFLLGESQGWWSLVGCHLWDRTELDTSEAT